MAARPRPPRRLFDQAGLEHFLIRSLPLLVNELASAIGRRGPQLTRRDTESARRRLRRFLEAVSPLALAHAALSGEVDPRRARYAVLEALTRVQLRFIGIGVKPRQDALALQLECVRRAAQDPHRGLRRVPAYARPRRALERLARGMAQSTHQVEIAGVLDDWNQSRDLRGHVQFLRGTLRWSGEWMREPPRRLTDRTVDQLARQYLACATYLEQRLRLLLALCEAANGAGGAWAKVSHKTLGALLGPARAIPEVRPIAGLVERRVRNALAHGLPDLDFGHARIRFHDLGGTLSWTPKAFYERTNRLFLGALALTQFELILRYQRLRRWTRELWEDAR